MKQFQIIACLFALFALGVASGIGVTRKPELNRDPQQAWLDRRFLEDCERLGLSGAGKEDLRQKYDELAAGFRLIREQTAQSIRHLVAEHHRSVEGGLSREQLETYRQLTEERRIRVKVLRGEPASSAGDFQP